MTLHDTRGRRCTTWLEFTQIRVTDQQLARANVAAQQGGMYINGHITKPLISDPQRWTQSQRSNHSDFRLRVHYLSTAIMVLVVHVRGNLCLLHHVLSCLHLQFRHQVSQYWDIQQIIYSTTNTDSPKLPPWLLHFPGWLLFPLRCTI
jgi:hypothetical protein